MTKSHPIGVMELKKRKGYLNLSGEQDMAWAKAVTTSPTFQQLYAARPRCPTCKYEYSCHQINKSRSTGTIRCPRCGVSSKIEDMEVRK